MPSTTSIRHYFAIFTILSIVGIAFGTHKCVWVRGALQCQRDASKQLNVEVRVYDRDGFSILKAFDPDDLMGVTFTEADGTFQLDGCGDDFNWLPGLQNLPDPYIRIHHYCNGEHGETIELPEFNTFVPETYDLGIIVLDSKKQPNVSIAFPSIPNPRRRFQSSSTENGGKTKTPSKSGEEIKLFDVLDSKEYEEKTKKSGGKSANEQIIPVTRPDGNSNWEIPVELDTDSKESIEQIEDGKKSSNERRPNWTKQGQQKKEGEEE